LSPIRDQTIYLANTDYGLTFPTEQLSFNWLMKKLWQPTGFEKKVSLHWHLKAGVKNGLKRSEFIPNV